MNQFTGNTQQSNIKCSFLFYEFSFIYIHNNIKISYFQELKSRDMNLITLNIQKNGLKNPFYFLPKVPRPSKALKTSTGTANITVFD